MKTSLISCHHVTMGTKKAREALDTFKADYAALHTLLDACVIRDGRIERDFSQTEYHRWCSTAGLDMSCAAPLARWFRDLMAHLTHQVRFQLSLMEKAKGSAITSLDGLSMHMGEVDELTFSSFHAKGINPVALFAVSKTLGNNDHKKFMLTGDRSAACMIFHFDNNNVYMRNLISAIVLMELHRNCGSPVMKNRGESNLSWYTRIEEYMGVRAPRSRSDKPSKLPRKGIKSW